MLDGGVKEREVVAGLLLVGVKDERGERRARRTRTSWPKRVAI